jgi:hypothetical protein
MIKKMWVLFDGMDVVCCCDQNNKKCNSVDEPKCEEYVVKFTKIERNISVDKFNKEINRGIKEISKLDLEIKKSMTKFKVR